METKLKTNPYNLSIKDPSAIVEEIFSLPLFKKDRDKDILVKRFGLMGESKMTLDGIGRTLGITRERVRQIEKNALSKVLNNKESKEYLSTTNRLITNYLKNNGLLYSEELIAKKITGNKNITENDVNSFSFLLSLNNEVKYTKENKLHSGIWSLKEVKGGDVSEVLKKIIIGLEEEGKTLDLEELASKYTPSTDLKFLLNILESSKQMISVKNNWGLRNWRFINPKSIFDKIQIIFSEKGEPLHYGDITSHLNEQYITKKITKKAVHNELIKNDKFVLIGRGIYALKEWGYKEGTVEDVILEVLREAGKPLHKNEIIKKVLEKRIVKEATIIINLQKFRRVGKATYSA